MDDTVNLIEQGLRGKAIQNLVAGWSIQVEEVSSNLYRIRGTNKQGKTVSAYGINPEQVLALCVKRINRITSTQNFLQHIRQVFQLHK
jgi:hypothetical protein